MSEVEKLQKHCEDNNVVILGVTTSFDLGLSDKRPTAEEIASELNRMHKWLKDPVNKLTSLIEGHIFSKKDTIMCLENHAKINKDGSWNTIPMTKEEELQVRDLKKDVELFEQAVALIKELKNAS